VICIIPAKNADMKAAMGRIIVMGRSIKAYVIAIESTPDSGVAD
jgi:hypothetical protein